MAVSDKERKKELRYFEYGETGSAASGIFYFLALLGF
jgi:hypothetical protein